MPDMLSFSAPLAQVNVTVGDDEPVPGLPYQTLNGLRAKGLLPEDGFPIFIEPDGSVDETLLRFLLDVRSEGVSSLKSIQGYAQDVRVLKRYLGEALGKGLLDCSLDDFRQFKRRRTTGDDAVSGATWNRILAACERFYGWAHERGLIGGKPFRYKGERIDRIPVARNTFAERRVDQGIKCVTLEDYEFFRDVGMRGLQPDGTLDSDFRGRFPLRNAAFAEFLVTSGARLQEAAFTLTCELPDRARLGDASRLSVPLASALAKNGQRRNLPLSRRVLGRFLAPYLPEERNLVIQRRGNKYASAASGNGALERVTVVENVCGPGGTLIVSGSGRRLKLDRLGIDDRRSIFTATADGHLVPMSLWVGEQGFCPTHSAWEKVFHEARRRCAKYGRNLDIHPHTLRHTFAVQMLSFLIKATIGTLVEFRREFHRNPTLVQKVMMDPMRELQKILGHRSIESTLVYLTYVTDATDLVDEAMAEWEQAFGGTQECERLQ